MSYRVVMNKDGEPKFVQDPQGTEPNIDLSDEDSALIDEIDALVRPFNTSDADSIASKANEPFGMSHEEIIALLELAREVAQNNGYYLTDI